MIPLTRLFAALSVSATLAGAALAGPPTSWRQEWPNTDFMKSAVDFSEIMSGGPPRDGIPALTGPSFIPAAQETRLDAREPVITLKLPGTTPRAYPVRYLIWHEIVNDVVDGIPVAITFCPLCNSAVVYDRRLSGRVLDFGVTGKLRNSDMVMYDRQTESWWQQALGVGIVGEMTGRHLIQIVSWMESWKEFRDREPGGLVMDQPNWRRAYGQNPYVSYDRSYRPFLYAGELPPDGIPALARVVRVGNRAWTFARIRKAKEIREAGVTISWTSGQASALDARRIGSGRNVGSIRVRDAKGRDLAHDVMFAFAFHAFFPDGEWMLGK